MTTLQSPTRRRTLWIGAVVAALTVAGVAVQMSRAETQSAGAAPAGVTETSGVLVGDPAAPVTVDIYADLLCPACRGFERTTGETVDELVRDGDINVRYHVITFLDRASTNRYSSRAAGAAYCAADSAQFPDYLRLLYALQPAEGGPGHDNDALLQIADGAGVTSDGFTDCVLDERYTGFAVRVTDAANQDGVTSTPTVLVDGAVLEDRTPAGLETAVAGAS